MDPERSKGWQGGWVTEEKTEKTLVRKDLPWFYEIIHVSRIEQRGPPPPHPTLLRSIFKSYLLGTRLFTQLPHLATHSLRSGCWVLELDCLGSNTSPAA